MYTQPLCFEKRAKNSQSPQVATTSGKRSCPSADLRINDALGPMSNIPAFYQAFGVKPGQPMWRAPADRVRIW